MCGEHLSNYGVRVTFTREENIVWPCLANNFLLELSEKLAVKEYAFIFEGICVVPDVI